MAAAASQAAIQTALQRIFHKLFDAADPPVLDYIITAICDGFAVNTSTRTVNYLSSLIGDMLVDYDLIASPKLIVATCTAIIQQLHDAKITVVVQKAAEKTATAPIKHENDTKIKPTTAGSATNKAAAAAEDEKLKQATADVAATTFSLTGGKHHAVKEQLHAAGVEDGIMYSEDGVRMRELYVSATERHRPRLVVHSLIQARYHADRSWYKATVELVNSDGSYAVNFTDYGNTEQVELQHIKIFDKISYGSVFGDYSDYTEGSSNNSNSSSNSGEKDDDDRGGGDVDLDSLFNKPAVNSSSNSNNNSTTSTGNSHTKLLKAPIRIGGDSSITSAAAAATAAAKLTVTDQSKANFLSKKQLKKEAKERAKQAVYTRQKETKRLRAEKIKFDAISKYLAAAADTNGTSKSSDVDITGVQLSTPDGSHELLANAQLKFLPGRRYGLIGRNGVGKTTLLRAINYYDILGFPEHLRVMHVEQEVEGDERMTVIEAVLSADVERRMLLQEEQKLLLLLGSEEVEMARLQAVADNKQQQQRVLLERQRRKAEYESEAATTVISGAAEVGDVDEFMRELEELEEGEEENDSSNSNNDSDSEGSEEDESEETEVVESKAQSAQHRAVAAAAAAAAAVVAAAAKAASLAAATSKHHLNKQQQQQAEAAAASSTSAASSPSHRLQRVYQRMAEIDMDGAEARARVILSGLQFSAAKQNTKTSALSGGWRMRVALAAALFVNPDLLLLDEPTNHLDFPAVLWLEQYLQTYTKTLIIVSHDRSFLNTVVTDVVHYYQATLTYYKGDYSSFEKIRSEQQKQMKREFEAQQLKREHIQSFIDRFRFNANRAALVQSRVKMLAKMDLLTDIVAEAEIRFSFPQPEKLDGGQLLLSTADVSFGYDAAHMLLKNVTCGVDMDSRVGVLGANGVGKSTLIHLLIGKLEASSGMVYRDEGARLAVFAQHHVDQLRLEVSPVDLFTQLFSLGSQHTQQVRRHLGGFGITGDLATSPIGTLSGGQKSRVAFAVVTWKKPHMIVMDEPTNHLDLETIDALISALHGWNGGVLVVSHDQHFLTSVCSEFWAVSEARVKRFDTFAQSKKYSYTSGL